MVDRIVAASPGREVPDVDAMGDGFTMRYATVVVTAAIGSPGGSDI